MPADITVHIGPSKTATTSLQRLLFLNQELLRDFGVVYPRSGRIPIGHEGVEAHHNLANSLGVPCPYDVSRGGWRELYKEISHLTDDERVVISSEGLFGPAVYKPGILAARLSELKSLAPLRLVFALRNEIELAESIYCQRIKGQREECMIAEHVRRQCHLIKLRSERLIYLSRLVGFTYSVAVFQEKSDNLLLLLRALGIPKAEFKMPLTRTNVRDGAKLLSFLMCFIERGEKLEPSSVRELRRRLKESNIKDIRNFRLLTEKQQKMITSAAKCDIRRMLDSPLFAFNGDITQYLSELHYIEEDNRITLGRDFLTDEDFANLSAMLGSVSD